MYNKGILTSEEFTKAKSILLQIDEILNLAKSLLMKFLKTKRKNQKCVKKEVNKKEKLTDSIKIERIFTTTGSKFTNKWLLKIK